MTSTAMDESTVTEDTVAGIIEELLKKSTMDEKIND